MASMSNPVQQLLNAEKKAALLVNDARMRKYRAYWVTHVSVVPHVAQSIPFRPIPSPNRNPTPNPNRTVDLLIYSSEIVGLFKQEKQIADSRTYFTNFPPCKTTRTQTTSNSAWS